FVSIKRAVIKDTQTIDANGRVDVAFTSSVFSAIKNANGAVISGDDKRMAEVIELWTFERNLNDAASTWRLSETHDLIEHA
ncbi:MAG: TIM44-like domain-containing protein, partial [Aestuariivirga sp.]